MKPAYGEAATILAEKGVSLKLRLSVVNAINATSTLCTMVMIVCHGGDGVP